MPYGQWLKALPSRPNVVVEVKQQVIYGKVKHTSLFDDKEKEKEKPMSNHKKDKKEIVEVMGEKSEMQGVDVIYVTCIITNYHMLLED